MSARDLAHPAGALRPRSSGLQLALVCGLLRRLRREESGQAMVESAIVIPLMTFLILGIIQLVMIQQAKIMTEYAAFNAARAGIVWNADRLIMENAALISLLPTNEGLRDDLADPMRMLRRIMQRALLYQLNRRLDQAVELIGGGAGQLIDGLGIGGGAGQALNQGVDNVLNAGRQAAIDAGSTAIGNAFGGREDRLVRVDILNPTNVAGMELAFDSFENRANTRLTIRVRYMYMMRIPFANWVIHGAWMAGMAGQRLYGAIWSPHTTAAGDSVVPGSPSDAQANPPGAAPPAGVGFTAQDVQAVGLLADNGVYMVPLTASYTMRMQSDIYRTSLQQLGAGGP